MKKKILSVIMTITMLLSMVTITPFPAYATPGMPTLTGYSIWREDGETASIRFMSSELGTYYYTTSDSSTVPSFSELTTGSAISDTHVTFSPSGLSSGEKYVHVAVKNTSDNISEVLTVPMLHDYCYFENFEVYPLNTTIASTALNPIVQIHDGNGAENQKVVESVNSSSEKMLTLSSASNNASDQVVYLDKETLSSLGSYVFEGDVYPLGTDGWQLRFSFTNGSYESSNEAGVFFIDGKITTATRNSSVVQLKDSYNANQWHHVKIVVTPSVNKYAVYVDNELLNDSLPLPSGIDRLAITAGHGKTAYYDNLEFYANVEEINYVCEIGTQKYTSLSSALATVTDGDTITLLQDITYSKSIVADGITYSINLNGNDLTVENVPIHALQAINSGTLNISDESGIGTMTVNSSGAEKYAAYADLGGSINITGNLSAEYTGGLNNQAIFGAYANGKGSTINIIGNLYGYTAGVYAHNDAVITVTGDVSGSYYGAYAAYNGLVDISGNINAVTNGLTVEYGGLAEVNGNITGSTAIYIRNGIGWNAPIATITGNVISTGSCAINVSDSSNLVITGNIEGCINVSGSSSIYPEITINGDIIVASGHGISIYYGGTVTLNGAIYGASPFLILNNTNISEDDNEISEGYYVYSNITHDEYTSSDLINTVKILQTEPPTAENLSIAGEPLVGLTLTGKYSFASTSYPEGETSYRWLRVSEKPSLLGEPFLLYTTNNIYGVTNDLNGPPNPTTFTVTDTSLITKICNYHYSSMDTPGTISLQKSDGTVYGPWNAVLNGYWCVYPNITIPKGTYTIIDSKPASWSFNSESGNSGMTEVAGYTIISDAIEQTYTLHENDNNKLILFEVTVRDILGNVGTPVLSNSFGPILMPIVNQAPVLTTNWNYNTVYFGQNYPFTINITDYENSPNARLYSFIDNAEPSQAYVFQVVPGTVNIQLSPLEGVLSEGNHTLSYYAVDANGASSEVLKLHFTVEKRLSSDASLSNITLTGINLTPSFNSEIFNYSSDIDTNVSNTVITVTPSNNSSTVIINEAEGNSKEIALSEGNNTINIVVIAEDQITTKTYIINITRVTNSSSSGRIVKPSITVTTRKSNGATFNSTLIPATISSGNVSASITPAIVDALLDKAMQTGGASKGDIIEAMVDAHENINKLKISIPQTEFNRFKSETNASFGVNSPFISILFDEKAVETIAEAAKKGNVIISTERLSDYNGRPVYDLKVTNNGVAVADFNGGLATVTIPYRLQHEEDPDAVVVYYLADDGTLHTVLGQYNEDLKAVVFKTTHFSKFVIGYNQLTFVDIAEDAWYKNAVDFITARGISTGTGNNSFSPNANLTRAQFVVMLMNAYQINVQNKAELSPLKNFDDAGNTYYTEYLLVAKSLGIVNGVGNNLFAPEKQITRQEMCVMLYNALDMLDEVPASLTDKQLTSFNDGEEIADWAEEALSVLLNAGIINGHNNSLYPLSNTTRAEIAQVFYNLLSK